MKTWQWLLGLGLVALLAGGIAAYARRGQSRLVTAEGKTPRVVVYKSPTCSCCGAWAQHMRAAGFEVEERIVTDLPGVKQQYGVPGQAWSCHTAVVEGYVIEGHVPAAEVQRLLQERPADVVGLAVPGMPVGSPGMEAPGQGVTPYAVLTFDAQGQTAVYATYP